MGGGLREPVFRSVLNNPAVDGYFTVASQSDGHGGVEDWVLDTSATAR